MRRLLALIVLAAIAVGAGLAVVTCSRQPSPPPALSPPAEVDKDPSGAEPVIGPETLLVRSQVLLIDHAGAESQVGSGLLTLARRVQGGPITPEEAAQLNADLATLVAAGQATVASSPMAMVLSNQDASIAVGQVGVAPASAFNLTLDLRAGVRADNLVESHFELRLSLQTGDLAVRLAELGLPVGDRGVVQIESIAPSGQTLLGLCEMSPSSDLGAAIVLLATPQVMPAPPAPAAKPGEAPAPDESEQAPLTDG